MKNKVFIFLSFLLSAVISFAVVAHAYNFLAPTADSKFLLLLAIIVIEVAYITLPYIASVKSQKSWVDIVLVGALFFLSVIPASMQTSSTFREQLTDKIIEIPIEPKPSNLISEYKTQINQFNIQIQSNLDNIKVMISKNFITKSGALTRQNDRLNNKKFNLLNKIDNLETTYIGRKEVYDKEYRKYKAIARKNTANSLFDYLKLSWSLALIIIFQLANGRFIFHGSTMLEKSSREFDSKFINKDKTDNVLISLKDLSSQYYTFGVGKIILQKFTETFDIKTKKDLNSFILKRDFISLIDDNFTKETAKKLKRFCNKIKKKSFEI